MYRLVLLFLFVSSSLCFFDFLSQNRNNLVQIANYTVISNIEDWSRLIFIDGNDDVRLFHAGHMLDRTGNTDGKVYVGTNGLTSLSNL